MNGTALETKLLNEAFDVEGVSDHFKIHETEDMVGAVHFENMIYTLADRGMESYSGGLWEPMEITGTVGGTRRSATILCRTGMVSEVVKFTNHFGTEVDVDGVLVCAYLTMLGHLSSMEEGSENGFHRDNYYAISDILQGASELSEDQRRAMFKLID